MRDRPIVMNIEITVIGWMLSRPRLFDRILVLTDIAAGRSNDWIATNRSHGRALVRSIRFTKEPTHRIKRSNGKNV
jgi:hypothetical protein